MGFIIRTIRKRMLKDNKNYLLCICGAPGYGKSYTALSLCEQVDPTFNIDRVVFTPKQFMELLNSNLKGGQMVLFDDAGVGMASREWYSWSNKAISYILQTFRHELIGVIFTTPDFSFLDSQARKLFTNYCEMIKVDYNRKQTIARYYNLQHQPKIGKTYFKYPRERLKSGKVIAITPVHFNKPDTKLCRLYERKKRKFAITLRQDLRKGLHELEAKEEFKVSIEEVIKKIRENPKSVMRGDKYNVVLIQARFKVSKDNARIIKSLLTM